MVSPLTIYNTNDLIYGYLLASRYRSPWVYTTSNAEQREPDIWQIILRDTDLRSMRQRRNQNIIRPWRVSPSPFAASRHTDKRVAENSKRIAGIVHEALGSIANFNPARFLLADAYVLGRRYAEIKFKETRVSLDGTPPMTWYLPVELVDADRRRFHWTPRWEAGKLSTVELEMFDIETHAWTNLGDAGSERRKRWIEYVYSPSEETLNYGEQALEALFFTHYFKANTMEKALEGIDMWAGRGILTGTLDSLRAADPTLDSATLTTKTLNMLKSIRSQHVAVLGDGDKLSLLESSGTSQGIAIEFIRLLNESAERLMNGAVRQAGHSVDGSGARAASETESETAENFYQYPREDLDACLNRDLVGSVLYYNDANFQELGLVVGETCKRPVFESEQVKRQNPKERVEVLNQSKVPIGKAYYYSQIDAPIPEPDEETVEPAADPAMIDAQLNDRTGFPETSDEAKQHEKDLARRKRDAE